MKAKQLHNRCNSCKLTLIEHYFSMFLTQQDHGMAATIRDKHTERLAQLELIRQAENQPSKARTRT
jgi:hypothetical protein